YQPGRGTNSLPDASGAAASWPPARPPHKAFRSSELLSYSIPTSTGAHFFIIRRCVTSQNPLYLQQKHLQKYRPLAPKGPWASAETTKGERHDLFLHSPGAPSLHPHHF